MESNNEELKNIARSAQNFNEYKENRKIYALNKFDAGMNKSK